MYWSYRIVFPTLHIYHLMVSTSSKKIPIARTIYPIYRQKIMFSYYLASFSRAITAISTNIPLSCVPTVVLAG